MENPPALLLGDDPVNVLGVARNLGRLGIPVYRLGSEDNNVLNSRFIKSTWVSSGLDDLKDARYQELLNNTVDKIGRRVVLFPLSDIHVLKVSSVANALDSRLIPVVAKSEVAETLVNKTLFYNSLKTFGVPHPESRFPKTTTEFLAAADEIGYPVYVRPEISPLFARKFRKKGMVASNRHELVQHLENLLGTGINVMLQEIIPGGAECMHGCAGLRTHNNEVLVFCYRRIREYPHKFGCGSLLTSVPSFVDKTPLISYLENIGYVGIFDAEYKLDPRDGVYKNIEINARSWWQNLHPSASGLNLIKATYDYARGEQVLPQSYSEGATWSHLYNDFFARKNQGIGFFRWANSLRSVDVFDIWASDDKLPMIAMIWEILGDKIKRISGIRDKA